jgi:hypothetical protein
VNIGKAGSTSSQLQRPGIGTPRSKSTHHPPRKNRGNFFKAANVCFGEG